MDNMHTPAAASAPRKVTMLFAVVATGVVAATATVDDEPDVPLAIAEARAPERVDPPPPPKRRPLSDLPLVLRNGAPACGNTMSKAARPTRCYDRRDLFDKLEQNVTVKVNVKVKVNVPVPPEPTK